MANRKKSMLARRRRDAAVVSVDALTVTPLAPNVVIGAVAPVALTAGAAGVSVFVPVTRTHLRSGGTLSTSGRPTGVTAGISTLQVVSGQEGYLVTFTAAANAPSVEPTAVTLTWTPDDAQVSAAMGAVLVSVVAGTGAPPDTPSFAALPALGRTLAEQAAAGYPPPPDYAAITTLREGAVGTTVPNVVAGSTLFRATADGVSIGYGGGMPCSAQKDGTYGKFHVCTIDGTSEIITVWDVDAFHPTPSQRVTNPRTVPKLGRGVGGDPCVWFSTSDPNTLYWLASNCDIMVATITPSAVTSALHKNLSAHRPLNPDTGLPPTEKAGWLQANVGETRFCVSLDNSRAVAGQPDGYCLIWDQPTDAVRVISGALAWGRNVHQPLPPNATVSMAGIDEVHMTKNGRYFALFFDDHPLAQAVYDYETGLISHAGPHMSHVGETADGFVFGYGYRWADWPNGDFSGTDEFYGYLNPAPITSDGQPLVATATSPPTGIYAGHGLRWEYTNVQYAPGQPTATAWFVGSQSQFGASQADWWGDGSAWTLHAGAVYKRTRSSRALPFAVVECDASGANALRTLTHAPGTAVAALAPGQWREEAGVLYVRRTDDLAVTADNAVIHGLLSRAAMVGVERCNGAAAHFLSYTGNHPAAGVAYDGFPMAFQAQDGSVCFFKSALGRSSGTHCLVGVTIPPA